ncbi:hypothetical protein EMIHUDRAFT_124129, partial [Emiliania huxleyi CCMP1516]|uniref:Myosin motor domain-containing protein n=2 Tax=Emiliania huxleyi TaxID=2903 RepID=A0A0D3J0S1_EMIH1
FSSVGKRFVNDLNSLLDELKASKAHFVRCIKPNSKQVKKEFEPAMVLDQLRCSGVVEAVRVMTEAYPTRIPYEVIHGRYAPLMGKEVLDATGDEPAAFCEAIAIACDQLDKVQEDLLVPRLVARRAVVLRHVAKGVKGQTGEQILFPACLTQRVLDTRRQRSLYTLSAESTSSRPDPLCYLVMEEARAAEQALKEAAAKAAARSAAATTVSAPADARSSLANMIRGRAGCSSAGGRAAAAASGAAEIVVSGCGNESINGTYRRDGERDGVPCYRHAAASWTIERDTDRSAGEAVSEWCICDDYGFESHCF